MAGWLLDTLFCLFFPRIEALNLTDVCRQDFDGCMPGFFFVCLFVMLVFFLSATEVFFVFDVPHLKASSLGFDHHYVLTVWGFSSC